MSAYLFDRSTAQGRLELTDRDRLDLLHRMSTNDVNRLAPGEGCATVLTTALARIIDLVVIYHRGDIALLRSHRPDTVRAWLARHIFWQDKIKVRDVSAELGQLELHGPGAEAIVAQLAPGAADLPVHHTRDLPGGGLVAAAESIARADAPGFVFITPNETIPALRETILQAGEVREGDAALYEQLRVAAGLPGPTSELTEDYIPLEVGLWDAVSFTKGCYIGQEIIARMESRNKLAKTLVGLRLDAQVEPGARLFADDSPVGSITSAAADPDAPGLFAAIGFVKPDYAEIGMTLTACREGELPPGGVPARVVVAPRRA
jgi:folate-binding protein YgfZ